MTTRNLRAAAAAIAIDRIVGEPPISPHPLSVFGTWMKRCERSLYRDSRVAGFAHLAVGIGTGIAVGTAVPSTTAASYLAIAGKSLDEAAATVEAALLAGDLDGARRTLPALVGRDPSGLDGNDMARAVIESLAENTVDAVIAPALWGAVAGARGALAYRAINTLDAMVGHHNDRYEHFGWASARTDDLANYLPARLAAGCVIAARPRMARPILEAVRRDAPRHPSPNGGVIETAFAVALGIRLGGPSTYGTRVELRPALGSGPHATPADIAPARRLALEVGLIWAAVLAATPRVMRRATATRNGR